MKTEISNTPIIDGEIVKDMLLEYFTIVHTYDGTSWFATGLMGNSKEEVIRQFGTWQGIKDYRIVKMNLPVTIVKEKGEIKNGHE